MPPPKKSQPLSIGLIRMGRLQQRALRIVVANIQAMLEAPVDILPAIKIPEEAFQKHRCQHDAGLVLKYLSELSVPDYPRLLAITDVDLCSPIHTFVYGEAELGKNLAIVSNFRLLHMEDGVPAPEGIYYERLVKVALHEIGHTLSLYHCETPKCLMQVSRGLRHLDDLDIIFCDRCSFLLSETMKHF
jgi:archaemetzincin